MGEYIFDQYTLIHFSVGIIMYFLGINLHTWIIIHILFEIFENSPYGLYFFNKYLNIKGSSNDMYKKDHIINSIGDIIGAKLGWLCASYIHKYLKIK